MPGLERLLVVAAVGEDMVDGPRIHGEQPAGLEDHRVQHHR